MISCKIKVNPNLLALLAKRVDEAYAMRPSADLENLAIISAHKELAESMALKAMSKSFETITGGKISYRMPASQAILAYALFHDYPLGDHISIEILDICSQLEHQLFIAGPFTLIPLKKQNLSKVWEAQ